MKSELKFTGERCIPEYMAGRIKTYQHHLNRYSFALMYVRNKTVLDAACGCGFGTNLFFDVANYVLGVDNDQSAIDYARDNYRGDFSLNNLNDSFPLGMFDIVVSFETLEHLDNPEFFIENVKSHSKEFLFSIPIDEPNSFHKKVYSVESVQKLIGKFYKEVDWFSQKGLNIVKGFNKTHYLIGHAKI